MKNNSGLWNATIGATLKVLQDQGLALKDLALLRSNKDLAKKVVDLIKATNGALKVVKKKSDILNLLSGSEKLYLPESDGLAIIAKANDVFKLYISHDFKKFGLNRKSRATLETEVEVYEMVKNANFKDIFISLSDNLDSLCLTQNQIIDFCKKYRGHLRQGGYGIFFLTKKDFGKPATEDNLFVVDLFVYSFGLYVSVSRFDNAGVWDAGCHRVVVPKLSQRLVS